MIRRIDGLAIKSLFRTNSSSEESAKSIRVIETRSVNVVFHGHSKVFDYEYYGIHRGTEDRLTFVGSPTKKIKASFIDCREGSATWGLKIEMILNPDISKVLVIPAGVAHTFEGLEDVYTLNSAINFLPDPADWLSGRVEWSVAADTINLSRDARPADIPKIEFNRLEAGTSFYELTSKNFLKQATGEISEYPLTRRFEFSDNISKLLTFKNVSPHPARMEPIEEIAELEGHAWWARRFVVAGDEDIDTGYTIFIGPNKLTVFDVGDHHQIINSRLFSANEEQRVTFFGPSDSIFEVNVLSRSNTFNLSSEPSPFRELVFPPGSDFELRHLKGVMVVVKSVRVVAPPASVI